MAIQAQLFSENLGFPTGNSSQDLLVENNGCGGFDNLCFAPQQQQHQFIHFDQFHNSSQRLVDNNAQFLHQQSINFSQSVSSHIERQRLEFEQFVNLQNERLRMAMQEQRKQQVAVLMKKYEWKTQLLVRQKEEEIARAASRTAELQNFFKRMEMENMTWQRAAKESEAMIASLNESIQRLRESAENAAEDAESCCEEGGGGGGERKRREKMVCKCCNSRNSCVVMLPCRHLCSCKDCEVFLDSCPVCTMPKKSTIQALF